jgi:beta-galactosidase
MMLLTRRALDRVSLWTLGLLLLGSLGFAGAASADIPIVDLWRFTLETPPDGWEQPDFDDAAWQEGYGGFGSPGRDKLRVDTAWEGTDIWLRKIVPVTSVPEKAALYVNYNDDAEVYLNGHAIATLTGGALRYKVIPLESDALAALQAGANVLAVHGHNAEGMQFVDAHLIAGHEEPELPLTHAKSTPFKTALTTKWGRDVTPENAWTEYPRPQLARDSWQNLNGHWDYAITPVAQKTTPEAWDGQILVPFALESRLGGVQRLLQPNEALWYRRTLDVAVTEDKRTLLNFEAVDYRCEVWVNGVSVGTHQGGNTPFSFDVTAAVQHGANEVVVRVEDETAAWQLHGKQVIEPRGIWYTRVSGIWQTVWLEQVAESFIEDLHIGTDAAAATLRIAADLGGEAGPATLRVTVKEGERAVATADGPAAGFDITLENPTLWTPDSPHLYALDIDLLDAAGNAVDHVNSYTGLRSVGKVRDEAGHLRFTMNGETIFHWGPLDQGWWPDGLLTPPSDAAMLSDIAYLKAAGFNMIRKHIKVEPRRYYYHCDRLGMMVWQDQPSGSNNPPWTFLQPDPKDADWPDAHHTQFMRELEFMVDTLENHPSIVVWVPFNEAWGQHRTMEVGQWLVARDPSRLVNIASGGNFWPVGDIADAHAYPEPNFPFDTARFGDFVKVVGEFGGHGFPVEGHLWNPAERNWGYGQLPETEAEHKARYRASIERLNQLRGEGVAAGVYTQTTDVEVEINGLLTYDRAVAKLPAEELAMLHRELLPDLAGAAN